MRQIYPPVYSGLPQHRVDRTLKEATKLYIIDRHTDFHKDQPVAALREKWQATYGEMFDRLFWEWLRSIEMLEKLLYARFNVQNQLPEFINTQLELIEEYPTLVQVPEAIAAEVWIELYSGKLREIWYKDGITDLSEIENILYGHLHKISNGKRREPLIEAVGLDEQGRIEMHKKWVDICVANEIPKAAKSDSLQESGKSISLWWDDFLTGATQGASVVRKIG